MNYFSQSNRKVSDIFNSYISFLGVNWNNMLTVLMSLTLSQALKFFAYRILIIVTLLTIE